MSETTTETAKQVKLSKHTGESMKSASQQLMALNAAARIAQEKFEAAYNVHIAHVSALVQDAGYKVEDFGNYGLWEDKGDVYLRANPQQ